MPRPALHADLVAMMAASTAPPLGSLAPAAMRESYAATRRALAGPVQPVHAVEDFDVPGPGGPLPLRLYHGDSPGPVPAPCLLYFHGGGWVLGGLDTHDALCRRLALGSGGAVLSVDYRLAPEHPFPAAVDDGAAALAWLVAEAPRLGLDPARIAVGGDSAGGNLAAVIALMGRDGAVPRTTFQVLFYPVTDMRMESDSYAAHREGVPLTSGAMRYFVDLYVPRKPDRLDWRASPLLAPSLAGAPAALILTCGHDPLASEGREYAARLDEAGVPATALHLPDQAHGILNLGQAIGIAPAVLDFAAAALKDAWRVRP